MDAMKLLIADGNEEFRRALAAELQGAYHVRCCGDGKEALRFCVPLSLTFWCLI